MLKKPYRGTEALVNNLIHTKLELEPEWEARHLHGTATLDFKPYFYPSKRLILDAKFMDIHSIDLLTDSGKIALDFTYDSLYIDLQLDRTYTRFETYRIAIEYTAKPQEVKLEASQAIAGAQGLYFIDPDGTDPEKPTQIWTQGQTESSSCWFPTIDQPNERSSQEVFITVSDNFKTLSNGELIYSNFNAGGTRTDYWRQDQDHPPYLFMLAVGEFVIAMDSWENSKGEQVMVNYYVEPEYGDMAYKIFGETPAMMSFYSDLLDYDYPWKKYSQVVVRDFVSGAMENTTATVHGEFLQQTDREMLDDHHQDIIAHELFHHWFGDLVTCESWSNLPLNESFATYGEYLWNEHRYGLDEAEYWRSESLAGYFQEAQFKREPLIRFEYNDKDDMFDAHSYNKGGGVLHMLRGIVGDDAFFASLNHYLKTHQYSTAEIHDLRQSVEHVTGQDFNWFFEQWFLGTGHPELEINYTIIDSTGQVIVDIDQVQNGDRRVFEFPLTLDVYDSEGKSSHELFINERKQSVVLPYSGDLYNINSDADKELIAYKEEEKPMSWWLHQMQNAPHFLDRKEALNHALDSVCDTSAEIIELAFSDSHWSLRDAALFDIDPYVKDYPYWEATVFDLTQDERSYVRATAIGSMALFWPDLAEPRIKESLNDPSYTVVAAALEAVSVLNPKDGLAEAKALENLDVSTVQESIAYIYSIHGGPAEHGYFIAALETSGDFETYELLSHYGEYLSGQELPLLLSGLDRLEAVARDGEPWWIKYGAYSGFNRIEAALEQRAAEEEDGAAEALESLRARLDAISDAETDTRLFAALGKFADRE